MELKNQRMRLEIGQDGVSTVEGRRRTTFFRNELK